MDMNQKLQIQENLSKYKEYLHTGYIAMLTLVWKKIETSEINLSEQAWYD